MDVFKLLAVIGFIVAIPLLIAFMLLGIHIWKTMEQSEQMAKSSMSDQSTPKR